MSRVIAVANQKGGVGKTTTSINLAACLAEKGKEVLLLDSDPQGNATSGLGIAKAEVAKSVYDVLINDVSMLDIIIPTDFKHLWVAPATIQLAGAEVELVNIQERESAMKRAVDPVRELYDYIIVDCPPSLSLLTVNALMAANSILIPIQSEFYALEGVTQLIDTVEQVQQRLNPHLQIEGVLLTMYDVRTRLANDVVAEVKKYFADYLYKTMIPRSIRLAEAPSFGQPINYYDNKSRGTEAYRELAREVIKHGR